MFKFFKKKEEVPLPPPKFRTPLQEPLIISVPPAPPSILSSLNKPETASAPIPEPPFISTPTILEASPEDITNTASGQLITIKTEPESTVQTAEQTLLEPTQYIADIDDGKIIEDRKPPEKKEEQATQEPTDTKKPAKIEIKIPSPPPKETPAQPEPSLQTLDEEFILPDFEDITPEEGLRELPSFEDIPRQKIPSMSVFVRAFDYLRITNEKKSIIALIAQTYKQTEELTKIASDQHDLYEQWYGNLNTCQEKLIRIDTNLFEQVKP